MSTIRVSVKEREVPFVFENADIDWNFDKYPNEYLVRQSIMGYWYTVAAFPKVNVLAIEVDRTEI